MVGPSTSGRGRSPRAWRVRRAVADVRRRARHALIFSLSLTLTAGLLSAVPARAETPDVVRLQVQERESVKSHPVKARPRPKDLSQGASAAAEPAPVWPAGGIADVSLSVEQAKAARRAGEQDVTVSAKAGSLPVWVGSPGAATPGLATRAPLPEVSQVRVHLLDRASTPEGWKDGLLLRLEQAHAVTSRGRVNLAVDYSSFANAYGGDWSNRLRLLAVPECALTQVQSASCRAQALPSHNDLANKRVSADVDLAAGATTGSGTGRSETSGLMLALAAAPSGSTGDYSASSLQASSSWSAGGSSGDFSWSYPMRTPPSLGGPAPELNLSYSSSAVDGRSDASNNQPSWIGEGFDYWPGFIERQYKACNDDKGGDANNTTDSYDECWGTDNAVMSLNGSSNELVRDGATGVWKPKVDDGSRIQRLTDTDNEDDDNEYWKVTDAEGTQYFFGLNRLTGWTSGKPTTKSTWTVPVAGNNATDPCRKPAFIDSFCDQAWRWNLDYVVDVHGNTMSMWYTPQTNKYARNVTDSDDVSYVRGGVLEHIDYGTDNRAGVDTVYTTTKAPMRVLFTPADRCLSACDQDANWKDTPKDQECTETSCEGKYSPTFWTTSRLAKITTQVWNPAAVPVDYKDVDSWAFTHTFPNNGDSSRDGMWLESIVKSGHVGLPKGSGDALPEVNFDWVQKPNRVDALGDDAPPMHWMRMGTIWTESGGKISITYSDPQCVKDVTMPSSPETNTLRCYPVLSEDPYTKKMETEYFHKYVVNQVTEADWTGGGTDKITSYEYLGGAGWRHTDDDGLTKDKLRTWADYRGYGRVRVRQGIPGKDTLTETRYFRGLHGDKTAAGGTSTSTVTLPAVDVNADGDTTDSGDAPQANDEEAWAGMPRQQTVFNGVDTDPISTSVNKPWQSAPTASRDMGDTTVYARHSGTDTTWQAVKLDAARGWRVTRASTTFDPYGAPEQVDNQGDLAVSGDESCIKTTYARNPSLNILGLTARMQTFALPCGTAPTSADDIIGDARTSYDGNGYYADGQAGGTSPTKGDLTRSEELKDWTPVNGGTTTWLTTGTVSYDPYGRVSASTDVRGNKSTTTYTPQAGGPVTKVDTAQTVGTQTWTTTAELEGAWGSATGNIDVNSKRTDQRYDAHGRLTKVWLPNRLKSTHEDSPSTEFSYTLRSSGGVNAVTTKSINPEGKYLTTYALYDGLLRDRQTQTAAKAGTGTIFTENTYDAAGRVVTSTDHHYDMDITPSVNLKTIDEWLIKGQTVAEYDRAGRVNETIFRSSVNNALTEKWRTKTRYGGDRTYVTPPQGPRPSQGGTPTTTIVDARGNTVELRQHAGGTTDGAFDTTSYTFNRKNQLTAVKDATATNAWTYGYDIRGRQTSATDPDKGLTTTAYNDYGDVTEVVDARAKARGEKLVFGYDLLGRRTGLYDSTISDATRRITWAYDPSGAKGQLASTSRWTGATRTQEYKVRIRGYSPLYQSTGEDYVIPTSETGLAGTYIFTRQYKQDGSVDTETYPNAGGLGGETVTHTYDSVTGQPEQLLSNYPNTGTYVVESGYTEYGELGLVRYQQTAQNYVDRSFKYDDATRRLAQATTTRQIAPQYVSDVHYDYDNAGNIERIADTPAGAAADVQCFDHDYLRRLTQAWTPTSGDCDVTPQANALGGPAPYWSTWTFDAPGTPTAGNLRSDRSITPAGTTNRSYSYPNPGTSRPHAVTSITATGVGAGTETYRYDESGSTTCRPTSTATTNTCPPGAGSQNLTWDVEGHLTGLTEGAKTHTYLYGGDGNRLVARDPTGATLYLPGTEIRYTTATQQKTATRYYTYAGETCAMRQTSTGVTWLVSDHQGTQQTAINAGNQTITKRRQTPYGTPRGTNPAWPNDKGFVGGNVDGESDPTGLTHIGARSYDPSIGQFVSVDPLIDFNNPQQMQGYSYSSYSPITFSDPTGRMIIADGGGGSTAPAAAPATAGTSGTSGTTPSSGTVTKPPKKSKCGFFSMCNVKKTYNSVVKVARDNAQVVGVVAGVGAGVWATSVCLGSTLGVGSVACVAMGAAFGGAIGSLTEDALDREEETPVEVVKGAVLGAVEGFVVGAVTAVGAPAVVATTVAIARGAGPKLAAQAGKDAAKAAMSGGIPKPGKACHSFAPQTPVLLANGTTRAIGDVKIGDEVLAFDPETGETDTEQVEQLHLNQDIDLANVTVQAANEHHTVLETTQNHPFWSVDRSDWVEAKDLRPGEGLLSDDSAPIRVVEVHNYLGSRTMRDLTVTDIHTYYVVAGDTPVLVHNCGDTPPGVSCSCFPATGAGPNVPPIRVEGPWTRGDIGRGAHGLRPNHLGGRIEIHHADQMPGSPIHELDQVVHRGRGSQLHPNAIHQGVTGAMRAEDTRLHWWYRSQEQGWGHYGPDLWYD
ncbi:polymorphic toxin-type HINT domain-containing protein [Micromonospora sp. CA-259024]|uniref:polymorphic toxin-type HINT domain-containing protein n=1 Tax=Micromonospora sp. CA-259024 TaxID=3239965 RepID=UPI003D905A2A